MSKIGFSFINDAIAELRKVHMPRRQETIQASIVVILMMAFIAFCLGMFDFALGALMKRLLT